MASKKINPETGEVLTAAEIREAKAQVTSGTPGVEETRDLTESKLSLDVHTLEQKRRAVAEYYKNEEKVVVQGAPSYQNHFGRVMPIVINGIAIHVPLDGQPYKIPVTYASEFQSRLAEVDEQERIRRSLANTRGNEEAYAGERALISKA